VASPPKRLTRKPRAGVLGAAVGLLVLVGALAVVSAVWPSVPPVVPETAVPTPATSASMLTVDPNWEQVLVATLWDADPDEVHLEWATTGPPALGGRIPHSASIPTASDLGARCDGGALIAEGTEHIALALAERYTEVALLRLFRNRTAVLMPPPFMTLLQNGIVGVYTADEPWPAGYYALRLTNPELVGPRFVGLCVGRVDGAVGEPAALAVPEGVDSATARRKLLDELSERD
jgi:hypothetical protein